MWTGAVSKVSEGKYGGRKTQEAVPRRICSLWNVENAAFRIKETSPRGVFNICM